MQTQPNRRRGTLRAILQRMALLVLSGVFFAVLTPTPSRAAQPTFSLENRTGFDIAQIYVSTPADNQWHLLRGQYSLQDGTNETITMDDPDLVFLDLKIVYNNGESYEWHNLNIFAISKVVLYFQNGQLIAERS